MTDPLAVLVPGLGLDARAWRSVRTRMTGASLVVALPSMGLRAPRGSDLHVERQGRRLLEALPPGRDVVLVGHSASCPVVVEAATRTSRVVGLVLVGPVTDPRARTWPRMLAQWLRTAGHEHLWEVPVLAPQYRATGAASMARGMNQMRRYRTRTGLSSVSVPTHVIRGGRDRIATAEWCAELADSPSAEVTTAPGSAHMVPLTDPGVVVASIESLRRSGATLALNGSAGPRGG
jgi:pimeloyl-ACP methyl ester carboxylesterase